MFEEFGENIQRDEEVQELKNVRERGSSLINNSRCFPEYLS